MSGSINNDRLCRTKHQTTYRRLKSRDFARVCKYVRGVGSSHPKSLNDSRRKVSQYALLMSVIRACWGSGKRKCKPRLDSGKQRLFTVILTTLLRRSLLQKKKPWNSLKAKTQLVRRALFPLRRTVQFSPHWVAQKQQARDSFVSGSAHSCFFLFFSFFSFLVLATITPLCWNTLI